MGGECAIPAQRHEEQNWRSSKRWRGTTPSQKPSVNQGHFYYRAILSPCLELIKQLGIWETESQTQSQKVTVLAIEPSQTACNCLPRCYLYMDTTVFIIACPAKNLLEPRKRCVSAPTKIQNNVIIYSLQRLVN